MSWGVYLLDERGRVCDVGRHCEGSAYVPGGSDKAAMQVTYNYGPVIKQVLGTDFVSALDNKIAETVQCELSNASKALGTERSESYWVPSDGNVGAMLGVMAEWARLHPRAAFRICP